MAKNFSKVQPKDGEKILVCLHKDGKKYHWLKDPGSGQFIVLCDPCFAKAKRDPDGNLELTEEKWMGNDPVIKVPKDLN